MEKKYFKNFNLLSINIKKFLKENWLEILLFFLIILFFKWDYDRLYNQIFGDLKKHYAVIRSLLDEHTLIIYRKDIYPPFIHIFGGLIATILNGGKDFTVQFFHKWIYNTWFIFFGLEFILSSKIAKILTRSRFISILCGLLIVLNPINIRLMWWFGFAQFLGVFFILLLFYIILNVIRKKNINKTDYILFFVFSLILSLTHQYSTIIFAGCLGVFIMVLLFLGLRFRDNFTIKLFHFLTIVSVIAAVVSFVGFNHRYIIKTGDNRTGFEAITTQLSGQDERFEDFDLNLTNVSKELRRLNYINLYTLSSFLIIGSISLKKPIALDKFMYAIFFLIPFVISLLLLFGHPIHFYTRMHHYWEPFAIFIFGIVISQIKDRFKNRALILGTILLLVDFLASVYLKK